MMDVKNSTANFFRISVSVMVVFFLCVFSSTILFAASETFTVKTLIGSDTTPPTTPVIQSVVPVSQTQIDVSWSASTDDFLLSGYQVFRDAVQVATTTLTNFSDTGLTASTTYTYEIRAFDSSLNFSATSTPVATTTPAIVVPPPIEPRDPELTQVTRNIPVKILNLEVDTTPTSARFSWDTSRYAYFELRWGRTSSYELGFVSSDTLRKNNVTRIDDLEPGTVYEYQLVAYILSDIPTVTRGSFTTDVGVDDVPPVNVSNLRAIPDGDNVQLIWDNPTDEDFSHVRVVRNYLFYPVDGFDGYIVYEGNGETVYDTGAFLNNEIQYYSVFAYDTNGNVSSGAIVAIQKGGGASSSAHQSQGEGGNATSSPYASDMQVDIAFSDIEIIQNGKKLINRDDVVSVNGLRDTTIRIPYEKIPEHLKAITVLFTHPDDTNQIFSFLLRVNKDKTAYEATVAPFEARGLYEMVVSIFDFDTEVLTKISGTLSVSHTDVRMEKQSWSITSMSPKTILAVTVSALILLILLFLLLFIIRRNKVSE